MADNTEQPAPKSKRRLRPSASETVRERATTSTEKAAGNPKRNKASKNRRKLPASVRTVGRPLGWIFRLIFPRFLRNAFGELRHVTWLRLRESRQLTTAVIIFSLIFGVFVSLLDYGLDQLFKKVILKQ